MRPHFQHTLFPPALLLLLVAQSKQLQLQLQLHLCNWRFCLHFRAQLCNLGRPLLRPPSSSVQTKQRQTSLLSRGLNWAKLDQLIHKASPNARLAKWTRKVEPQSNLGKRPGLIIAVCPPAPVACRLKWKQQTARDWSPSFCKQTLSLSLFVPLFPPNGGPLAAQIRAVKVTPIGASRDCLRGACERPH